MGSRTDVDPAWAVCSCEVSRLGGCAMRVFSCDEKCRSNARWPKGGGLEAVKICRGPVSYADQGIKSDIRGPEIDRVEGRGVIHVTLEESLKGQGAHGGCPQAPAVNGCEQRVVF